jgi:hypothetical protein
MFDYASWIERARDFVAGLAGLPGEVDVRVDVGPPLSRHEADELAGRLPMGLPSVLRDFLTIGSSRCDCHYCWEPPTRPWPKLKKIVDQAYIYGGPVLCHASQLAVLQVYRSNWAEYVVADKNTSRTDRELWTRCTPFANIANGDLLALDTTSQRDDAPVAYLSHEWRSSIIAPSFTEFLRQWEAMSYIGPEIWLLSYWIQQDTGFIDSAHPKSELLRKLLTQTA